MLSSLHTLSELPPTVLVVDDAPIFRQIATKILGSAGYLVEAAEDGAEAVESARRRHYSLILMDLEMPVMDGCAAAAAIRALPSSERVPILALTGRSGTDVATSCAQAGMDDVITKPFAPARLIAEARHWARREEAPGRVPVWCFETLNIIASRLGWIKIGEALELFETQINAALELVAAVPRDLPAIAQKAHGLTSTAGTLGFMELGAASRAVMISDAGDADMIRSFGSALDRALESLRRDPHAVRA